MKQVVQEAKEAAEEVQNGPVIPSLNRRRVPGKISSPALRNQLEDTTNEFSEICDGSATLVQTQIEVHPRMCSDEHIKAVDTSHESLDSTKYKSLAPVFRNLEPVNNNDCANNEKTKKLPLIRKKKNFKRIFIRSRSKKSMVHNGFETDESQRLNLASPAAQSTMLQKSAQVNVSLHETRLRDDGTSTKRNDSSEYSESPNEDKEQLSSRTEASREMVSLINRQSVDGKSMCDVTINGLTMNQSDLLDLFEATEARSVSMMTTEEALIITTKFHRRKNGNETVQTEDDSQKQSGAPNLMIPPIYVTDYSTNETSYRAFRKMKKTHRTAPRAGERVEGPSGRRRLPKIISVVFSLRGKHRDTSHENN
ncbi:uncharacterized protein LOC143354892 [Halictus rubicundus]|uniref:uncharacterized protein LOC143354892 n=1 Tax=Halictus rubicundus TaxID=77578 RepID=UPI004037517C